MVPEHEGCPVPDELIGRLYISPIQEIDNIVSQLPPGPRGSLAAFCYSRAHLRDIGLVLAADNAVALDAVIATMMGCDPARLLFLQRAKEMGLGDYDLQRIDVIGELRHLPDFKLPPLSGEAIASNPAMQAAMDQRIGLRPQADPDLCTGCGTCVDQCPVSALSMSQHVPEVDSKTCIRCFCCQEICPERAIALR